MFNVENEVTFSQIKVKLLFMFFYADNKAQNHEISKVNHSTTDISPVGKNDEE